ncbi:MAG: cobalt ECF transporter T component CbiQ [Synechococcales bacterium]|nr:cobalt ECF transporter T component CbiQ [Synechococcales bacterium]
MEPQIVLNSKQTYPKNTLWRKLAPHTRILTVLFLVVAIAVTPNGRWLSWGMYGCITVLFLKSAQINWGLLGRKLAIEFTFIIVLLIGTLFHPEGDVIWRWGGIRITTLGVTLLGSIIIKSVLCLLLANLLILSTPTPELLHGLALLNTPPLLLAIVTAMVRYMNLMGQEVHNLKRAANSRNLTRNPAWRRQVFGNMMGLLFLRTLNRGERVYNAMIARGYVGLPSPPKSIQQGWYDGSVLVSTAFFCLMGQLLSIN